MDKQVCREIVMSVVEFLRGQQQQGAGVLDDESSESVEVAIQCLESAYGLPPEPHIAIDLYTLFKSTSKPSGSCPAPSQTSEEKKKEAEAFKEKGNACMREAKYEESIVCYTNAIKLDPENAVFLCNRAAAYSKLNQHQNAVEDCKSALKIDPNYTKAHGRMGLAYSELGRFAEARDSYRKALELEPANEGYQNNLAVAEERVSTQPPANPFASLLGSGGGLGALAGGQGGVPDISGLLSNPALMNMASSLMQNPDMQNMMSNILGGAGGQQPPPNPAPTPPPSTNDSNPAAPNPPTPGLEGLLSAGQQLAEQLRSQHPEILEQFRNQMGGQQPPPGGPQ